MATAAAAEPVAVFGTLFSPVFGFVTGIVLLGLMKGFVLLRPGAEHLRCWKFWGVGPILQIKFSQSNFNVVSKKPTKISGDFILGYLMTQQAIGYLIKKRP